MACPAGTLYRNYFAPVKISGSENLQYGQSEAFQINNLDELEIALGNQNFWQIKNDYTFSEISKLKALGDLLKRKSVSEIDQLRDVIKVGVQQNVGVVFNSNEYEVPSTDEIEKARVTQVYCSAISCGYSRVDNIYWEPLARLVLEAAYEATLWSALACPPAESPVTPSPSSNRVVFLTFLGGGVFQNDMDWILQAMARSLWKLRKAGAHLQVKIYHYRRIDEDVVRRLDYFYRQYQLGG